MFIDWISFQINNQKSFLHGATEKLSPFLILRNNNGQIQTARKLSNLLYFTIHFIMFIFGYCFCQYFSYSCGASWRLYKQLFREKPEAVLVKMLSIESGLAIRRPVDGAQLEVFRGSRQKARARCDGTPEGWYCHT